MKMTQKIFNDTMRDLWSDPRKGAPLSVDFLREAWETYNETLMTMGTGTERDIDVLQMLLTLDESQRVLWRTALAESGYEMTPIQVDQYISIVELALEV